MERIALEAKLRSGRNTKGELNRMRGENQVPAVVYGRGKEATSVILDGRLLRQALSSGAGSNAIVELGIKNGEKDKEVVTETVMFKDVQRDILVSERLLHVDFIRISLTEKILADVPLQITGESPGVKEGGVLQVLKRDVEVNCLPAAIPDLIEVDISSLEIGDSLMAKDLVLPEEIELQTDPEETLVQVLVPVQEEEVEEAEAEEEAADAAAGEEAEESAEEETGEEASE